MPEGESKREAKSGRSPGGGPVAAYSEAQAPPFRAICETLRGLITRAMPEATSKVWHGSPVWFIGENPVVGYTATAKAVNLLFWNGRAFDDPLLDPVGKYSAAQATFSVPPDPKLIRGWLRKAKSDVFDSKGFFKELRERRRGDRGPTASARRRPRRRARPS
ncbi:MAG: DUF1801 domain-containing protein [Planctomycetes bacterium]|nr:DUF1801 domain-containing protein [Planctomycetota bacterium]